MILHEDSHTDHVTRDVLEDKNAFFVETVELPSDLPVQCGLYGPIMGDDPVSENAVTYQNRSGRDWVSRLVDRPLRPTRQISVVAGPYNEHPCVLYTCFGGPVAMKEPQDPTLSPENLEKSQAFWREHALSMQ
jgi:hypothetical protein